MTHDQVQSLKKATTNQVPSSRGTTTKVPSSRGTTIDQIQSSRG
jgi:hypothetical protein